MLANLICAALILVVMFPKSPVVTALREAAESAVRRLCALTPGKTALALLKLLPIVVAVIAVGQLLHGHAAAAMAAPDGLTWLYALDVATYMDVAVAVFLMSAAIRLRAAEQALRAVAARARAWLARRLGPVLSAVTRARARRPRRRPFRDPGRGEDDRPAPGFAFA